MKYNNNYDNYSEILINMPQFEKAETIRFNDVKNNTLNETVGIEKINLPHVQQVERKPEPAEHAEPAEQSINKPIERLKQMEN